MGKTLVMGFLNEEGKKSSIRVNNVRDDITEAQVSAAMDVIIAKNIFATTGGDLKVKDSAQLDDKKSTEMKVK